MIIFVLQTLMTMVPATLTFLLVLHWVRRKCNMEDWEIYAFLATHVRMRHFTCDQIWRMDDIMVAKGKERLGLYFLYQ